MIFNTSAAYKVGDTVQIISKQEVDRLPRDQWGNPVLYAVHPNKLSFVLGMKPFCGKEFTVVRIVHNKDLPDEPVYFLNYLPDAHVDPSDDDSLYSWSFTSAMLLPAAAIPIPSVSFDQLLQGAK